MKDFEFNVRVRNNHLKERRLALGLSAPKLAAQIGVSYSAYIALENLRQSPLVRARDDRGCWGAETGWSKPARQIADFHRVAPDALFPGVVLAIKRNEVEFKIEGEKLLALVRLAAEPKMLPGPDVLYDEAEAAHRLRQAIVGGSVIDNPIDTEILCKRFGLGDEQEMTLDEVGRQMGLSREGVRQREVGALQRLRRSGWYDDET